MSSLLASASGYGGGGGYGGGCCHCGKGGDDDVGAVLALAALGSVIAVLLMNMQMARKKRGKRIHMFY